MQKKAPTCPNCQDTGLYDACCRPHFCSCEAGRTLEVKLHQSSGTYGGGYGDYPTITPTLDPLGHALLRPLSRGYDS